MEIQNIGLLRRLILPVLSKLSRDIKIDHHYTQESVYLNSFKHKGYWFHGKNREKMSMELFAKLIDRSDIVIEVGGHIGYISLYFASLVPEGRVFVFEPGANNLPYMRKNILGKSNITLLEKGIGASAGKLPLYLEDLTGQNNSFVKGFERLNVNSANAFVDTPVKAVFVDVISLDNFVEEQQIKPGFIKIDVEGFELSVVKGMLDTLDRDRPICMIEVQSDHQEIYEIMKSKGYLLFSDSLLRLNSSAELADNTFCLHPQYHSRQLQSLGLV
jgi:FkbM family methyltransferase